MSSSHRPKARPIVESLETRSLLTGGAGSTFALIPATVASAGGTVAERFTIDKGQFTGAGGKVTIGIDVATATTSKLNPKIIAVLGPDNKPLRVSRAAYSPRVAASTGQGATRGVLVTIPVGDQSGTYTVVVAGQKKTSGDAMLGFYMPGDSDGSGAIDATDISAIQKALGARAGSANYSFEADANRDGIINRADLKLAKKNLGAKSTIEPTVSANIDPASVTTYQSRTTNVELIHMTGAASAGATITYEEINGKAATVTTTADASNNYGLFLKLGEGSNTFKVTSTDSFGQVITGTIDPIVYNPSLMSVQDIGSGGTAKTT